MELVVTPKKSLMSILSLQLFLIEIECKAPYGCLTFIFYQKCFFFDKMDLMRFYFHVTRCLEKISCGEDIVVLLLNIVKDPAI